MAGQYGPGFLTDLVREIRDAARIREDAMYSRVRAMVVERNDVSINWRLFSFPIVSYGRHTEFRFIGEAEFMGKSHLNCVQIFINTIRKSLASLT